VSIGVIRQNDRVSGKRAGVKQKSGFQPALLFLALGITGCVVAWGYLVWSAIDFGSAARHDGDSQSWWYLGIAAFGAVACLFLGLMLVVRFSRRMGWTSAPDPKPKSIPTASKGGKRAAR
jgi:hypothetical protein